MTQIRNNERVDYGNYDDKVSVIPQSELTLEHLTWADQLLANTNKTVNHFNNVVRDQIYGLDSPFPYEGEKLLCLRNNWSESLNIGGIDQYLVNGLLGRVDKVGDYKSDVDAFHLSIKPLFLNTNEIYKNLLADGIYFMEGIKNDSEIYQDKELHEKYKKSLFYRKVLRDTQGKAVDKFTFGYCVTTYKSQGSEWENIMYYRDLTNPKIQKNSDYVAVTRARESLIYVK